MWFKLTVLLMSFVSYRHWCFINRLCITLHRHRLNLNFVSIFLMKYHWILEIYIYTVYVLYKYKLKVLEVIYNICVCIASCLYTRYRTHTTHFVNSTYNIVFLIYICFKDMQTCWISSMYVACTNQYALNQYSLRYLSPWSSIVVGLIEIPVWGSETF